MTLPGTPEQHTIILAAAVNATVGAWLLYRFLRSRWWSDMVIDPATNRVKAGDQMKAGAFVLACAMTAAQTVAYLAFGRAVDLGLAGLTTACFGYSGVLQDNKRLEKKDQLTANTPVTVESKQTDIKANQVTVTE